MIQATSCGGIVICRGKILVLYKNVRNRYDGWVLPKGTVETGETHEQTALREVYEEGSVRAQLVQYVGESQYSFRAPAGIVSKTVYWYLMTAKNCSSRPQKEEFFTDSGYYKYNEAWHLLKYSNERQILTRAYSLYLSLSRQGKIGRGSDADPGQNTAS